MASKTLLARGGLTYVDRRDFTRGDSLRVGKRIRWPSVSLWVEDSRLTLSSRAGSDVLQYAEVTALPHGPIVGRHWALALAVSFSTAERDQVLLFGLLVREQSLGSWLGLGGMPTPAQTTS